MLGKHELMGSHEVFDLIFDTFALMSSDYRNNSTEYQAVSTFGRLQMSISSLEKPNYCD